MNYKKNIYDFDILIVGAGGAGLQAALHLSNSSYRTAVFSKVHPIRSHTIAAQGGINASLGNVDEDNWKWHMFDTVKGSDYLGDQNCIEYMCRKAKKVIYELENMGLPFSRTEKGLIYQRPFGGQSKNFGKSQATRTCAAEDRTGHALLHTLYQQNIRNKTIFFTEWFVIDLVKNEEEDGVSGISAICIETGELAIFRAKSVILATGGSGQIFYSTTNSSINTGDGLAMVLRSGWPLQDMEMWQFHPTGILGSGVLISEGSRGEGGYLINKYNERFMKKYAPKAKDLASRDVVSRSIANEIKNGNAFKNNEGFDFVKLKLKHLGEEVIKKKLPGIRELSITFSGIDPIKKSIPVIPTSHYLMGGIPTNINGEVISQDKNKNDIIVKNLYAIGECACVSVHGANRLGGNSLLDLVVFGYSVGKYIKKKLNKLTYPRISNLNIEKSFSRYFSWEKRENGESFNSVKKDLKIIMQKCFGVFRNSKDMLKGIKKLKDLDLRLKKSVCSDKSKIFNTSRLLALELDNLMLVAKSTALSSLRREESRGAHYREDFPLRDDKNWLKHSLYFNYNSKKIGKIKFRNINMNPKYIKPFKLKKRKY